MVVGDNATGGIDDDTWSRASEPFPRSAGTGTVVREGEARIGRRVPGPNGKAPFCPVSLSSLASVCTFNVLSLLREVAAYVAAAPSQRLSTGINWRERQSCAGCACQDRSGTADDLGQASNKSNSSTGMVHVSRPVLERRSRYAGERFRRGQLCSRPLKQTRGDQFPVKIGWLDLPRTRRRDYLPRIAPCGPELRTVPRRRSCL
jgi:hypothetical protein